MTVPSVLFVCVKNAGKSPMAAALMRQAAGAAVAVDSAGIGAFDWELASDQLRWDERLLELFGLERETFGGTIGAFNQFVHADDLDRVTRALTGAVETCGEFAAEYRINRPDGGIRWVAARGHAIAGADGTAARVVGAVDESTLKALIADVLDESA